MGPKTILLLLLVPRPDVAPAMAAPGAPVLKILVSDQTGISGSALSIATDVADSAWLTPGSLRPESFTPRLNATGEA